MYMKLENKAGIIEWTFEENSVWHISQDGFVGFGSLDKDYITFNYANSLTPTKTAYSKIKSRVFGLQGYIMGSNEVVAKNISKAYRMLNAMNLETKLTLNLDGVEKEIYISQAKFDVTERQNFMCKYTLSFVADNPYFQTTQEFSLPSYTLENLINGNQDLTEPFVWSKFENEAVFVNEGFIDVFPKIVIVCLDSFDSDADPEGEGVEITLTNEVGTHTLHIKRKMNSGEIYEVDSENFHVYLKHLDGTIEIIDKCLDYTDRIDQFILNPGVNKISAKNLDTTNINVSVVFRQLYSEAVYANEYE